MVIDEIKPGGCQRQYVQYNCCVRTVTVTLNSDLLSNAGNYLVFIALLKKMANRRLKPNWTKPSINKQVSAPRGVVSASSLSPWAQQEDDIIEDFERNLQMMETTVAQAPWEEGSRELRYRSLVVIYMHPVLS